ncbi:type I pantothenate kinase [Streptomyces clavuligerus]|uniref:Pantothenate kinase n=3 Tax=Streptomyces clavuligerus TaxID=1901 RepID=E2Q2F6_STRCL|nr:type I pantothenate kinase [Streptomyces clavuligerus]ANW18599.1 type I pantothenate kinase [Streptomyces clavuligerus]AXU13160.1 type I pantothenate kinase [Streptomyces clavuligerus]EFG08744.1 Pantothenate kinase [Streptomyces clavuligerus]MBY6303103.1 type I pantothenate kinase [Streptomyces clavuligerus]QCS05943.1 type I pantothenate kinase [Streptomyces clavuligerus]
MEVISSPPPFPSANVPPTASAGGPRRGGEPAPTPFVDLTRAQWSALRDRTPLPLTADEVERLRGLGDVIDLDEVRDVYLPLSRLLNLYVQATGELRGALNTFLGDAGRGQGEQRGTPFVIGVAGSVAVGKSTVARLLQALLARWPEHPRVERVTTDGFLYPMKELRARGLMSRKGFPESYDRRALTRFVADVKSGKEEVTAPVYSHLIYDIVPGERLVVRRPDILIVEGLNVLQPAQPGQDGRTRVGLADYFDFSVYVDARPEDIESWYLHRFRRLRETAFQDPSSYFRKYTQVSEEESMEYARTMWRTVNQPNLLENVAPTRGRATLILRKGADHKVRRLSLRKL